MIDSVIPIYILDSNWKLDKPEFIMVISSASESSLFIIKEVEARAANGITISKTVGRMNRTTCIKTSKGWLYSITYSRLGIDFTSQIIPAITPRKNVKGLICSKIIYFVSRLIIFFNVIAYAFQ